MTIVMTLYLELLLVLAADPQQLHTHAVLVLVQCAVHRCLDVVEHLPADRNRTYGIRYEIPSVQHTAWG